MPIQYLRQLSRVKSPPIHIPRLLPSAHTPNTPHSRSIRADASLGIMTPAPGDSSMFSQASISSPCSPRACPNDGVPYALMMAGCARAPPSLTSPAVCHVPFTCHRDPSTHPSINPSSTPLHSSLHSTALHTLPRSLHSTPLALGTQLHSTPHTGAEAARGGEFNRGSAQQLGGYDLGGVDVVAEYGQDLRLSNFTSAEMRKAKLHVGPGRYCPPRQPSRCRPSCLELSGIT